MPAEKTPRSRGPDMVVTGWLGELLAAVWYQGVLRSQVRVSPIELWKAAGHGVEIFTEPGGLVLVMAVNHPWVEPTMPEERDAGPAEHQL